MGSAFHKRQLVQSVALAAIGTGASMSTAYAGDVLSGINTSLTNDANPTEVHRRGRDPSSLRIQAGETEVTISGYVKADFIYDSGTDLGDSFAASSIPTGDADDGDGHFRAHARQSRLTVRSSSEVGGRTLKTVIEGDLFGGGGNEVFSNSSSLRLRHASITYGKWTIGQNWTNFMDFVAYPSTVDFFGPAGKSFLRQAQIRYTLDNGLSFSLENPETTGAGSAESLGGNGSDQLPDITAAWRGGPGGAGGSYETAVVLRSLGVSGLGVNGDDTQTVTGFGINLAGAWDFGVGKLAASITSGSGIGRYIINGFNNDVFIDANGDLEAVDSLGASVSYLHRWSDSATSLVALGFFDNDDVNEGNGTDAISTLHINYMWSPVEKLNYGVELIVGNNDTAAGDDDAARLQFGAQLNF